MPLSMTLLQLVLLQVMSPRMFWNFFVGNSFLFMNTQNAFCRLRKCLHICKLLNFADLAFFLKTLILREIGNSVFSSLFAILNVRFDGRVELESHFPENSAEFLLASAFLAANSSQCESNQWDSFVTSATVPSQSNEKTEVLTLLFSLGSIRFSFFLSESKSDCTRLVACQGSIVLDPHHSALVKSVLVVVLSGMVLANPCSTSAHDIIKRTLYSLQMPTRLEPRGWTLDASTNPDSILSSFWSQDKLQA